MAAWFAIRRESLPPDAGSCRGCGAPILWVTTVADRRMPMDRVVPLGDREDAILIDAVPNHWASCPARERFARPAGRGTGGGQ